MNRVRKREKSEVAWLYQLLIDSAIDYAIFALDRQGHIVTWNAGAKRIKGYDADEIIGKHFSIFYPPQDLAVDKPGYELVVAARESRFEDEGWRVRKDGSMFWANVVITREFRARNRNPFLNRSFNWGERFQLCAKSALVFQSAGSLLAQWAAT